MAEKATCVTRHSAFIFDRGAMKRISPVVDLSKVMYERTRDGITDGMIRLEGDSCSRQNGIINSIRSKRHELVIYRGNSRAWEGPIFRIASGTGYAEIWAKDVISYLDGQPLTQTWDNTTRGSGATEVTTRLEQIIEYELSHGRVMRFYDEDTDSWVDLPISAWEALDPPINVLPHLDVRHFPNEARTAMVTLPYQMNVFEHLSERARQGGIDYTALGRKILIWDTSRSLGRIRTLTSADFLGAEVVVTEYGADHTQAAYTTGQDGSYGQAVNPTNLDYYGPWTTMYTPYTETVDDAPSQAELDSQSMRNLAGRTPAPIEVRIPDNSSVVLSDTLTIDMLVPGVQVPLLATLNARPISQLQKLDHVTVTETADGESVQIMLTPATRADSDVEA
jgi:hypothetical protein